ncbi:FitA-like ribbon-helix-helix domain-containing protein [Jiella avicenniae]|uniref:Antitoxin FitA-like ribbon-helix-helix domain-containing protein n=1 Tax=Jiella avicenniae TaxID=2907202 RepID=A0A9X1P1H5_9HYPH|nr:hypothetical protein [Jiella avicenniae]MCE7027561.1 hypothetical protein [Jiella avicenniae]
MTSLTITDLDDKTTNQISRRASRHGRSMEDEARVLLQQALEVVGDQPSPDSPAKGERGESRFDAASEHSDPFGEIEPKIVPHGNLASRIRARFEPIGGVELDLPARGPSREPPTFD